MYTDGTNSRYYIFHREILRNTREERDKIRFKRKIYQLSLPLFLLFDRAFASTDDPT